MVGREFILALCEDSNSANQNPNGAVHLRFAAAFSENSRVAPRLPTKLKHSAFWMELFLFGPSNCPTGLRIEKFEY